MARLKSLASRLAAARQCVAEPAPKRADPYYATPEWKALREAALRRDGYRCTVPGCDQVACVVDHRLARRLGGGDRLDELRSLCRTHDNRFKEDHLGARRGGG